MSHVDGRYEIELVPVEKSRTKGYEATEDCELRSHSHCKDGRIVVHLSRVPEKDEFIKLESHIEMKVLKVIHHSTSVTTPYAARLIVRLMQPGESIED